MKKEEKKKSRRLRYRSIVAVEIDACMHATLRILFFTGLYPWVCSAGREYGCQHVVVPKQPDNMMITEKYMYII